MKKRTTVIAVSLAALAAVGTTGIYAAGELARINAIDQNSAVAFAMNDAGVKTEDAVLIKAEQDWKASGLVYDIEFVSNGMEYDYDIKASDGTVLEREMEPAEGIYARGTTAGAAAAGSAAAGETPARETPAEGTAARETTAGQTAGVPTVGETAVPSVPADADVMASDAALGIALSRAGLTADEVTVTELKLEWDDGVRVYDIDFLLAGQTKYEYEIDAVTGEIREESIETVRTAAPKTENTGAKTGAPAGSGQKEAFNAPISVEDAKAIALERAGKRADEVTFGKAKLERDDGVWSYEIEFFVPGVMEYEYEIDAETGAVLEEDVERWDD